jgi:hypothetical protein
MPRACCRGTAPRAPSVARVATHPATGAAGAIDATFGGASTGIGRFRSFMESSNALGNFDLGLQLYANAELELKAGYNVKVGSPFPSRRGNLRLVYHF